MSSCVHCNAGKRDCSFDRDAYRPGAAWCVPKIRLRLSVISKTRFSAAALPRCTGITEDLFEVSGSKSRFSSTPVLQHEIQVPVKASSSRPRTGRRRSPGTDTPCVNCFVETQLSGGAGTSRLVQVPTHHDQSPLICASAQLAPMVQCYYGAAAAAPPP